MGIKKKKKMNTLMNKFQETKNMIGLSETGNELNQEATFRN